MRVFVAVDAPPLSVEGVNFSQAAAHVTLRFLGERSDAQVAEVISALAPVASETPPFRLELAGGGAFPDLRRPRVVWVGVGAGAMELTELERRISDALTTVGIPKEPRAFTPHLTLFRVRNASDAARAQKTVERLAGRTFGSTMVDHLQVKESTLTSEGAEHRTFSSLPLRVGNA